MTDKIFVVTIRTEYGTNGYAGRTYKAAYQHVIGFVEEWWEHEMWDDTIGEAPEPPEDKEEMVYLYFEKTADKGEDWDINEVDILEEE